ncbi:exodeoxyribonuclease V subunit beta [Avibacterium sp. 21-586]|uniref:exodeoxyribonuclease V subunit beta n=1 Tax=Avibacterium sp. 21-586 TaxID=2911534 RepID=UPI00224594DE|nr:exodeoxyribonuclease V subunit beta [Avibacterium sp. 21-586]MCW9709699.1 exodeoxyribonuclease V subunit beta [Avibacterium sp. 21-586]
MTTKAQTLNPATMPLQGVSLIQASAGTGKTYTMASLYIRLLLQAGENCFSQPLSVDKILVVTFTEMATQELRERIRARIYHSKQLLLQYQATQDLDVFSQGGDPLLGELAHSLQDIPLAIQRLNWAEQSMDTAAIYTIHSFCRRMLMQYAFNSGVHFNLELVTDESDLLARLTNEFWRETFYHQPVIVAKWVYKALKSPQELLEKIHSYLNKEAFDVALSDPSLLELSLDEFLQQHLLARYQAIEEFKQEWLANEQKLAEFLEKNKAQIKNYRADHMLGRFEKMRAWAEDPDNYSLPDILIYFTEKDIAAKTKADFKPLQHPLFNQAQRLFEQSEETALFLPIVLYHSIRTIRQKLFDYKKHHTQKGFNDLLRLVREGLCGENGQELAALIRNQYPFAMIDEFQDTDAQQYQIFSKIYIENPPQQSQPAASGFIMIGDPKQSIYQFRGADIFTYFKASQQANQRFTLKENWRSTAALIQCVNGIFDFEQPAPFLFDKIKFDPVKAGKNLPHFNLNGQDEPALSCYLGDAYNQEQFAETCAISIQQWLKSAAQNQAKFGDESLQAKNIAVLVRSWKEALSVKTALQNLGIASVYLSDKGNVFDSETAQELALILQACLNPLNERHILNAIATRLFGLTSAEIYQIKQDENQWEHWVEAFFAYQKTWQQKGILVMLHQLLLNEENPLTERLLTRSQGERILTDFLHLAELFQQASRLNESEAALLRWFEKQIQGTDRMQESIRLESERDLVKIVTIHKSKGLAYDLVWLPFIAAPAKGVKDTITTYYAAEQDQVLWDMEKQQSAQVLKEKLAEEMRLLYVALTRAKYQVACCLPQSFEKKWNGLLYALSQGAIGEKITFSEAYDTRSLLQALQQKVGKLNVAIHSIEDLEASAPLVSASHNQIFSPAIFNGNIEYHWGVTSFTDMVHKHQRNKLKLQAENESAGQISSVFDQGKDYDFKVPPTENLSEENMPPQENENAYPQGYSPFDLPSGVRVGTILHRYLEKNTAQSALEEQNLTKLCQLLQLDEQWISTLQQWFNAIYHSPLLAGESLTLAQIQQQDCLKEMQFYLKLNKAFDATAFNRALQDYHRYPSQSLIFERLQGMLRGFIDLVFRHQGKYYVLDYKSNLLGHQLENYQPAQLPEVMKNGFYDWQYLLYTLALHRYLQSRDPHYQYERDFGGVIYTFLRGMNGQDQNGIYFDKPDWRLIQVLEELF